MAQIICEELSIGYDKKTIREKLSFIVEKGDYVCIIGENGAGKSTLVKTLLGLISPISGKIIFSDGVKRTDVGYLPQQTIVQKDFPATVKEVVISGFQNKCGLRPFYNKKEKAIAKEILGKLEIEALSKKCYRELSGGQQQKVLLARALCATQKVLLLDEPVSCLDPAAREDMYRIIAKLNSEGITIVMVSHDVGPAIKYAKHILYIKENSYYGEKEDFINSDIGKRYFDCIKKEGRND